MKPVFSFTLLLAISSTIQFKVSHNSLTEIYKEGKMHQSIQSVQNELDAA